MSKKETVLAAAFMGVGFGRSAYQRDLTDESTQEADIGMYSELTYYAGVAAAMVDAAFSVTFAYPEYYQAHIYDSFGDQLADRVDPDGDGFEMPDREEQLNTLEEYVYSHFNLVAVPSQQAALKSAIAAARQEAA